MSDASAPGQLRLLDDLPPAAEPALPRLAVTGLVSYARCPRQCYWDVVERRPRPLRPAARIGSLVHGWIEREAAGQASLLAAEDEPDPWIAELKAAFLASPWGAAPAPGGGAALRAVGRRDDGAGSGRRRLRHRRSPVRLEIVDFKTGRRPAPDDAGAGFQLDLYALAAVDCWGRDPAGLRTTEWYVREGAGVTRDWDGAAVDAVRERLADAAGRRWPPAASSRCPAPTAAAARTSPPAPKDRRRRGQPVDPGDRAAPQVSGEDGRRPQLGADLVGQVAGDLQVGPGRPERLPGRGEHLVVGVPVGRGEAQHGAERRCRRRPRRRRCGPSSC